MVGSGKLCIFEIGSTDTHASEQKKDWQEEHVEILGREEPGKKEPHG